jgi:PHD/YefM family antitoxin component YafN of YafNO toxin-antitoxin module
MGHTLRIDALEQLPRAAATDVKTHGWKALLRSLSSQGELVITNHQQPEAVILSTQRYQDLVNAIREAQQASPDPLVQLRKRFDERLSALEAGDASDRLRDLMENPGKLNGKVIAGSSY